MNTKVFAAWLRRAQLRAEGTRFYHEAECMTRNHESTTLAQLLRAKANMLYADGDVGFMQTVIDEYGKDERVQWSDGSCTVSGELYRSDVEFNALIPQLVLATERNNHGCNNGK